MFPPEIIQELKRLNDNLETLHGDAGKVEELSREVRNLSRLLDGMKGKFKAFPALARQINILNQIMLQSKKAAGTAGMLQTLFTSLLEATNRQSER